MPPLAVAAADEELMRTTVVTLGRLGIEQPANAGVARLLSQPKRFAVLLYVLLAQRGGSLTRDQVVGMFWPESDAMRASNALRQTLSFLRSCLGADAVVSVGTRGLSVRDIIACDAMQFDALLEANEKESALALYGGEFLSGLHVEGAPAFTDWSESRRRYYAQRAAKAAWDLSAEYEGHGDSEMAAFWGKRALALSPFSESEVQRVLRLLSRVGDYAGALRAFHGLQQLLRSEFGAAPSAETVRLAADVMERVQREGQQVPALLGTRRNGLDRRLGERRQRRTAWTGQERRVNGDRRQSERRTGLDRRAMR